MKQHLQVLLIEDNRVDASALMGVMAQSRVYSFSFITAAGAARAREVYDQYPMDLVIMDLNLEDTRGRETMRTLGYLVDNSPVIVFTGDDDLEMANDALHLGVQDYLVKGTMSLSQLEKAVDYALERHRMKVDYERSMLDIKESKHRSDGMLSQLDKVYKKLEEQHVKSRLLTRAIEQSLETVIITDPDGMMQYANEAYEKTSGYSRSEAMGKHSWYQESRLHDDVFYRAMWNTLKVAGAWSGRIKNYRKDGSVYEEDVRVSVVRDDDGQTVNYVAVKKDMSHEAALELQLEQARKLETIGQLAAGIAHEINTPTQFVGDNIHFLKDAFDGLQKVLSCYVALESKCENDPQVQEHVNGLRQLEADLDLDFLLEDVPAAIGQSLEGIERISRIVRAMKDFSYPGTEEMTPQNINKAIESTVMVCANEWKYVADVETFLDPGAPPVPCFIGELNQVVLNMIVNAAHAIESAKRDEKGVIRIGTQVEAPYFCIQIDDNGIGITNDVQKRVFDPFFTTKEVGKGTGQGLSIAWSTVVEKHRGQIDLASTPGEGTSFVIKIPLQQVTEPPASPTGLTNLNGDRSKA